jgi:hypothetical protein
MSSGGDGASHRIEDLLLGRPLERRRTPESETLCSMFTISKGLILLDNHQIFVVTSGDIDGNIFALPASNVAAAGETDEQQW